LYDLAADMLEEARLEIQRHNFPQADDELERIQLIVPDFFPAYVERARLFESRGMLDKAGEQWAEIIKRAPVGPWQKFAAAERQRVAREQALRRSVRRRKAPSGGERLPRKIRIEDVRMERVEPSGSEFDDMRVVNFVLRRRSGRASIRAEDVRVLVDFFDRVESNGEIAATTGLVPARELKMKGKWGVGRRRALSAAWMVPHGLRQKEKAETGREREYYGYVISVFYDGILQDRYAEPADLLKAAVVDVPDGDSAVPLQ